MVGLVCFLAMPLTVLMPIFADQLNPGHGARTLGFLMATQSCGALAGAVLCLFSLRSTQAGLSFLESFSAKLSVKESWPKLLVK
jgi:hypothetical protein